MANKKISELPSAGALAGTELLAIVQGGVTKKAPASALTAIGPTGPQGPAGPTGATGPQGATGTQGATGPAGPKGDTGNTGAAGAQGPQGVAGATGPAGTAGSAGTAGTNGTNGTNGAAGADGKTVRNGTGAPASALGVDGDFYIDKAANAIYGPKTSGAWGSATSLVGPTGAAGSTGPTGATGSTGAAGSNGTNGTNGTNGAAGTAGSVWRTGAGAPSNATGVDTDLYLNTANSDVYQRASGTYSIVANIKGATGAAGASTSDGSGKLLKSVAGGTDVTLTALESQNGNLEFSGALTANISVLLFDTTRRLFRVYNTTTGSFTLTLKTPSGTGVAIAQGGSALVECDGANVVTIATGGGGGGNTSTTSSVPGSSTTATPFSTAETSANTVLFTGTRTATLAKTLPAVPWSGVIINKTGQAMQAQAAGNATIFANIPSNAARLVATDGGSLVWQSTITGV